MSPARGRAAIAAVLLSLNACAGGPHQNWAPGHPSERRHDPNEGTSGSNKNAAWHYEVQVGAGATELLVEGSFAAGADPELGVDDDAERFVRDVAVASGSGWQPAMVERGVWSVPSCRAAGCRIRYRFLLADAASSFDDVDFAFARRGATVAPPSTWLLRPLSGPVDGSVVFHVSTAPGVAFATGVFPRASEADTFGATIGDLAGAPYTAFGRWSFSHLDVAGSALEIGTAPGNLAVGERAIADWIAGAGDTVARYYRQFPVRRALLLIMPAGGAGMGYGKTLGNGGASIVIPLGENVTQAALASDWVLVHEMIHLGFPNLPRSHIWLEEGIATYVEPIARARTGRLSSEAAWLGMVRGLKNGLPEPGDRGLDHTHTWGRTYWGGALFCLLADVEIRKRTANQHSLDDALRAILARGGNASVRWELARALAEGDAATGVPVLVDLHRKMGAEPYPVDLSGLFRELGVRVAGDVVTFDESAPLAGVRRSITSAM